jgi:hypothetical protein
LSESNCGSVPRDSTSKLPPETEAKAAIFSFEAWPSASPSASVWTWAARVRSATSPSIE